MAEKTLVELQDELVGALVGLARATDNNEDKITDETLRLITEGLMTSANDILPESYVEKIIEEVRREKFRIVPDCETCANPCGRTLDLEDVAGIFERFDDASSIKAVILNCLQSIASNQMQVPDLPEKVEGFYDLMRRGLFYIGLDTEDGSVMMDTAMKLNDINMMLTMGKL